MDRFKNVTRLTLILLLGSLIGACGSTPATNGDRGGGAVTINAVATTSIIGDLVQNVGGTRVNVYTILGPGVDSHTYSPTPRDAQAVASSQILFENGLGLEGWLEKLLQNAGGSRATVITSNGLTPINGGDPHMWFDVQRTIRYVENIRDGLKQVDAAGAGAYDSNAAAYIAQLKQLDAELVTQFATIPPERRKLVTNHDTFGYLATRYGFVIVGNVFQSISTDQEPSAQQIATLVKQIKAQNVPAIFTENIVNPRLAEQVGAEAGVKVVSALYTDALGAPGSPGDTYLKLMRYDAQQIVGALK